MTIVNEDNNLKHQPCPFVSCGSSDAFSYETVKGVGFCHSCEGKYSHKSIGLYPWAEDKYPTNTERNYMNVTEFTPKRIEDISEGRHEALRGVTASTMQDYNVLTYDDRQEYIYPSGGIKVRKLGEKAF